MYKTDTLRIRLLEPQVLKLHLTEAVAGTNDYERLGNRPAINGVTLSGDMNAGDLYLVSVNTEAGWAELPTYVPHRGEIVVTLDRRTWTDEDGETHTEAGIRIGDGSAYALDLPYLGESACNAVLLALLQHEADESLHVSATDRWRWDHKLECDISGERLIFTAGEAPEPEPDPDPDDPSSPLVGTGQADHMIVTDE